MPFVKSPIHDWLHARTKLIQKEIGANFGSRKQRAIANVNPESALFCNPSSRPCFFFPFVRQRNFRPPREAILEIELRLSMSKQNQLSHVRYLNAF